MCKTAGVSFVFCLLTRSLPLGKPESRARVLIVDDEPRLLDSISLNLRHHHDVVTAESGEEGLRLIAETGPFQVVISDMRMPKSGVEDPALQEWVILDADHMPREKRTNLISVLLACNRRQASCRI